MKTLLPLFSTLAALCCLVFCTPAAAESAKDALGLCAATVLPSLFPFFIISALLSELGLSALFGSPAPAALLLGLCGGYPMGAGYLSEQLRAGALTEEEAERLLLFGNNSGPAFLIGALGTGVFGSGRAGLILYAAHALPATALCLLSGFPRRPVKLPAPRPFSSVFPEAVRRAVANALTVCGFVVCFSVFTGLLRHWGLVTLLSERLGCPQQVLDVLLCGFFELGGAVGAMRGLPLSAESLALGALVVGWGGLSVQCQTAALFEQSRVSLKIHRRGRLLSASLGALLAWGLGKLLL